MKDQSKYKKQSIKGETEIKLTVNDALSKYAGPEFLPEKLKKVEEKFGKQIAHS
ncbi:hypothetical protein PQ469_01940 [Mucilaginibacter sp. KACC 22773]|jgi:hypothetical protein|uniref:hypothetical protein n=1 Tax=Mucilaginibacter sp. KACC 22773 TaxID=3025671 RepID=UPI0023655018|nr:hypothetical protein [Mucilaginibacter sp. KACC 22773]WDF78766.1 hypothetical protein PQ469_01940 [Mucilaginibacter sp. KACC 22773]